MDYTYPLPPKNLHTRYDSIFAAFKKGLCCTLIGLPLSARSGYLKFILEYSSKFLSEFINPDIYKFIVLQDISTAESLVHTLAAKILDLKVLDSPTQSTLENRLKIHDLHLTLASLETAVKSLGNKDFFGDLHGKSLQGTLVYMRFPNTGKGLNIYDCIQ